MTSYNYQSRQGILPISWEDFHGLCKALALAVSQFQPEIILPCGRGGYYPGTLISHLLQAEPYPIRLTRRVHDEVVRDAPQWLAEPPAIVTGKRVLVVDEISSSGETLRMVGDKLAQMSARKVRCAVLYAHPWGIDIPDYVGIITDALVLNPWDREILRDGKFIFHPEYSAALMEQEIDADGGLRISAHSFLLAKEPHQGE